MSQSPQEMPLFSTIDVSPAMTGSPTVASVAADTGPIEVVSRQMGELLSLTREMVELQREQVRHLRRQEERVQAQIQSQKQEFEQWLRENDDLAGRCIPARETIRELLGQSIRNMVEYIDENQDNLLESDYSRSDLVDRFGSLMHHVSSMYGVLKRLAAADQPGEEARGVDDVL